VSKLSGLVDYRIQGEEERAERYKERLIQNLEKMLAQERKRNERLVEMYQEMRFRLRSTTRDVKKVIPDEIRDSTGSPPLAKSKGNPSGSRLASRFAGLGRDDELRQSLSRSDRPCRDSAEQKK
jgi:hypothetical protein